MVREILQLGNPLLGERSCEIGNPRAPELLRVLNDLRDTLHDFQRRRGLAAASAPCRSASPFA